MAHRRRLARIERVKLDPTVAIVVERREPARQVHRLGMTIVDRLPHQRMVRQLDIAVMILEAAGLRREHGPEEIVGLESLHVRRHFLARFHPRHD